MSKQATPCIVLILLFVLKSSAFFAQPNKRKTNWYIQNYYVSPSVHGLLTQAGGNLNASLLLNQFHRTCYIELGPNISYFTNDSWEAGFRVAKILKYVPICHATRYNEDRLRWYAAANYAWNITNQHSLVIPEVGRYFWKNARFYGSVAIAYRHSFATPSFSVNNAELRIGFKFGFRSAIQMASQRLAGSRP